MTNQSTRLSLMLIGVFASVALAASAQAADSAEQASTAAAHAGYAAKAADIKMVHMHLHHAVNCLVGPDGEGFDASEANPCAAMGNGAIPDAADTGMKDKLSNALKSAQAGLATDDTEQAQKKAAEAQKALKPSTM